MIRILTADDHPLIRDALRVCIEDEADMEIVAEVVNGRDAIRAAQEHSPDVSILDLYLPDMDGIQVLENILKVQPAARVLFFTSSQEEAKVAQAIQSGALGYLLKDSQREEILRAIREVSQGRSYLSASAAGKLASSLRQNRGAGASALIEPLTQREEEILRLIEEGSSNPQIAAHLHISETTVRTHISHILQKMGLENRSQLLMQLLQRKSSPGRTGPAA